MGRSRMSIVKRQREIKKAEKAAMKRAKKHGTTPTVFTEPQPTFRLTDEGVVSGTAEESEENEETEGTEGTEEG